MLEATARAASAPSDPTIQARPTAFHPAGPTTADDQPTPYALTCPDGWGFCEGNPRDHSDPREHIHHGPEHSISGSYGKDLLGFSLGKFDPDGQPHICFVGEGDWRELDVPAVDQLIADVTAWLGKLKADREELARIAAPPGPEPVGARTWALRIDGGGQVTGTCPSWCAQEHGGTFTAKSLSTHLGDFGHFADFDGAELDVFCPGGEAQEAGVRTVEAFAGHLLVQPYAEEEARRTPTVSVEVLADYWLEDLDPYGLAAVIVKLRAQADRLDQVHAQLVQARADWQVQA